MISNVRRWVAGVGLAGGAAIIGMATAHADTPDDVIGQAIQLLNQGDAVLLAAPTADLGAKQADILAEQATAGTQFDPLFEQLGSAEEAMSPGDQSFLAGADEQLVTAAQNILSADQAFVAADQAGDLSSNSFAPADLPVIDADLGMAGANFSLLGDAVLAVFDPNLDALGASSASATPAADGSLATDIGLLNTAQADVTDAFNVLGQPQPTPDIFNQIEAIQTPLLSSDNSFVSGLGDVLFNGPDQQLAQASEAMLSAADAFSADPTGTDGLNLVSTAFQFDGSLLFENLPADVIGKVTDDVFGLSSAADIASSLDPVAAVDPSTIADVLSSIGL
jgi:hypothetical protein